MGQWIAIRNRVDIKLAIVATREPLTRGFRDEMEWRGPLTAGRLDDSHLDHCGELLFGGLELLGGEPSWFSPHRDAFCLDVVVDSMFGLRRGEGRGLQTSELVQEGSEFVSLSGYRLETGRRRGCSR